MDDNPDNEHESSLEDSEDPVIWSSWELRVSLFYKEKR